MGLVHVGLDFEHKGREVRVKGVDHTAVRRPGQGGRSQLQEGFQERLNAEVGQGGAEEHRGQLACPYRLQIHFPSGGEQLHVIDQLLVFGFRVKQLGHLGIVQIHLQLVRPFFSGVAGEEQQFRLLPVVNALEILAGANGPVHGISLNAQLPLHLVQQVEGVLGLPVHLINKGKNGNVPHGADLEQLPGLGLHALGTVNDHHRRVRRHQGAVGILGEVLVARGVQNVDAVAVILKLHHRRRDGNTTLLLNLHPVGSCCPGVLLSLDHTRLGDGAAVEQELLRQGGFTGVRVRNDGKGPAAADFFH